MISLNPLRITDRAEQIRTHPGFDALRIHLIAVGKRMPRWVTEGYQEYAKRMPPECRIELKEIAPGTRSGSADIKRVIETEGKQIINAVPAGSQVVAMEVDGARWDTATLAKQLSGWLQGGQDVSLMVGGADGLSAECRERAHCQWSLSPLTLPHALVRVVLAEQLYRAWTVVSGHPYHRG